MIPFPFFRYPYYNSYYKYNSNPSLNSFRSRNIDNNYYKVSHSQNYSSEEKNNIKDDNSINSSDSDTRNNDSTDQIFEIFGIKLHFDDILIICLLILLYNEGVKDYSLFISLILLLIS